ncbi:PepSY domain-containing protein [Neisseria animaloris]|uniref:Peptidase propeptide and YPEB domain n=1 Tax=Neisseria animaloris TaxID=326522 RepID=A0A3S5A260_9NEIS|nr:PepSY domain-containing protein [Neisseria animaloris]VEJ20679.1 Peptidase propeptide and YPEB domain [Neisseria animaloris]
MHLPQKIFSTVTLTAAALLVTADAAPSAKSNTPRQAAAAAKNVVKGHITDINLTRSYGRSYYEINIASNKRSYEVLVDAQQGRVLSVIPDYEPE